GADWPGLRTDLPSRRLQHEHAAAALQSESAVLGAGESLRSGFVVVVLADHPAATSGDDAEVVADLLAAGMPSLPEGDGGDPSSISEGEGGDPSSPEHGPALDDTSSPEDRRSLLDTAAPLLPRRLTDAELTELVG